MKKIVFTLSLLMLTAFALQAQSASVEHYPNGNKKWEGQMVGSKKVGKWTFYYESGQKMREGEYKDGNPYGMWKEWHKSGALKSEGKYIVSGGESVRHGHWILYHPNGALQFEGDYRAGKKVGTWIEYNKLGALLRKHNY